MEWQPFYALFGPLEMAHNEKLVGEYINPSVIILQKDPFIIPCFFWLPSFTVKIKKGT